MKEPIRITAIDKTDEEVRDRQEFIEKRLEAMGTTVVRMKIETGGFPTEWAPIVLAWMAGDKLEKKKRGDD